MSAFTDDDVTAALTAYEHDQRCPHADESWMVMECDRCMVTRMVAAVAPVIAARALREASDELALSAFTDAEERMVLWLRARAEGRETVVQFDMDPRLPVSGERRRAEQVSGDE